MKNCAPFTTTFTDKEYTSHFSFKSKKQAQMNMVLSRNKNINKFKINISKLK